MLSFALVVCFSAVPLQPDFTCASADTLCWKEQVLWYNKRLALTSEILTLERGKSTILEQSNGVLRKGYDDASALAEKMGEKALKNSEHSWTESPALWSSVTAVVVASLAIGIAQGMKVSLQGR